ncbi:glycosyltransferase, partial [Sulfurimonas sp.]
MTKLVLSIRSLDIGGAERQFIELVKGIDKERFSVHVCTMYPGVLDEEIKKLDDINFQCFKKRGRYDLGFLFHYKEFLRQLQPDIIYSWLGEMNLFSYWIKPKNT